MTMMNVKCSWFKHNLFYHNKYTLYNDTLQPSHGGVTVVHRSDDPHFTHISHISSNSHG